jgi:TonB-dependent starch-binding outer membrane protein SusC
MKTRLIPFFLLILALSGSHLLYAQKTHIVIKGTVLDSGGAPVSGATILVDGVSTSSVTDMTGRFRIRLKSTAEFVAAVSFRYGMTGEKISGRQKVDLNYTNESKISSAPVEEDNEIDSKYVNMGYSRLNKKLVVNSVSSRNYTNSKRTYSSVQEMICELPGVMLRGGNICLPGSFTMGGTVGPLIIVDNNYSIDYTTLSPTEVESITILKDGSAAIYGSNAFGGVILITRKKISLNK